MHVFANVAHVSDILLTYFIKYKYYVDEFIYAIRFTKYASHCVHGGVDVSALARVSVSRTNSYYGPNILLNPR